MKSKKRNQCRVMRILICKAHVSGTRHAGIKASCGVLFVLAATTVRSVGAKNINFCMDSGDMWKKRLALSSFLWNGRRYAQLWKRRKKAFKAVGMEKKGIGACVRHLVFVQAICQRPSQAFSPKFPDYANLSQYAAFEKWMVRNNGIQACSRSESIWLTYNEKYGPSA